MSRTLRILTADDLRAAITMREAIEAVREGYMALSAGRAQVPQRPVLHTPGGDILFMPATIQGGAASAVKVVSVYPENPSRGLPTVSAMVMLFDVATGQPKALMDGTYLTRLRTGAASGLATDLLAKPDAAILAVIGAGGMAPAQIEAVCAVRPIREIRIHAMQGAEALADQLRSQYPDKHIRACQSGHEALSGAEVIVAVTTSSTPVVTGTDVAAGAHINGIGSYTPQMQEIAEEVVQRARIYVDSRTASMVEAGDLIIPLRSGLIAESSIIGEIGEVAAGLKPGRTAPDQITFFKSVGVAVQDLSVAERISAAAEARNLGSVAAI